MHLISISGLRCATGPDWRQWRLARRRSGRRQRGSAGPSRSSPCRTRRCSQRGTGPALDGCVPLAQARVGPQDVADGEVVAKRQRILNNQSPRPVSVAMPGPLTGLPECVRPTPVRRRPGLLGVRPAHAVSTARESPGSGDDLSPDGLRAWGDRTVREDDVALDKEQIDRSRNRARRSLS